MMGDHSLRILFLLTQDLESPSGLGRYLPLAKALVQAGHRVRIAALHSDIPSLEAREIETAGVQVRYVAAMHVQKRGDEKLYYPGLRLLGIAARGTARLAREALRPWPNLIHVGKPHPMNGLAGMAGHLVRGVPLVVDCDDYEAGSGHFSGAWQRKGVAFFERWIPRQAQAVTTNTRFMEGQLLGWGVPRDRLVYLPNGVDPGRFSPPDPQDVAALRNELQLPDRGVVAFIGSLSRPSHPVELLITAFQRVCLEHTEATLLLVGGGEDRSRLMTLAEEKGIAGQVRFCGRVPPDRVRLYYALANVCVDPVHDDPAARGRSPLKMFESWFSGVPFVTAEVGDRPELAGDPPAALLAHPGDPDSLARALLTLLDEPDRAEELRARGRERVRAFLWPHLSQRVEQIYLRVLGNRQPPSVEG